MKQAQGPYSYVAKSTEFGIKYGVRFKGGRALFGMALSQLYVSRLVDELNLAFRRGTKAQK